MSEQDDVPRTIFAGRPCLCAKNIDALHASIPDGGAKMCTRPSCRQAPHRLPHPRRRLSRRGIADQRARRAPVTPAAVCKLRRTARRRSLLPFEIEPGQRGGCAFPFPAALRQHCMLDWTPANVTIYAQRLRARQEPVLGRRGRSPGRIPDCNVRAANGRAYQRARSTQPSVPPVPRRRARGSRNRPPAARRSPPPADASPAQDRAQRAVILLFLFSLLLSFIIIIIIIIIMVAGGGGGRCMRSWC